MTDLAFLATALVVVSLGRKRLQTLPITAPMLYVGIGLVLGPHVTGLLEVELEDELVALAAELTLALLLFADAARIDPRSLKLSLGLPVRLLGIGLPLTIAMGTVITWLLFPDGGWVEAALVAAILAPTDAALGEAVVSNPAVPLRIRQALNVESGLNDGMVAPVVAVFIALAAGTELEGPGTQFLEGLAEVGIGLGLGVAVALVIAWLVPWVLAQGWTDNEGLRLVAFGGALAAFAGAVALGGNGFLAAFLCGLALRYLLGDDAPERTELAEDLGHVGASLTFTLFGALMVWPAFEVLSFPVVLCALGSLTVGRMIPVWLATLGTGLRLPTVAFLGWFGPRGLASMVFGLLVVAEGDIGQSEELFSVIVLVIVASVLLHGITAGPGARRYGNWFASHAEQHQMPENQDVPISRTRGASRSVDGGSN